MTEQKSNKLQLSIGTWLGVLAVAFGIVALPHRDISRLEAQVSAQIGALTNKIDSFQAEMRDVHGRVSALEERTK